MCSTNDKWVKFIKPSPALNQLGLAFIHETWAYSTNTVLAIVAFLLLLAQTCFHKQALLTTRSYMPWQHSTKLLLCQENNTSKLIFEVPTSTSGLSPGYILIINALLHANVNRKLGKLSVGYLLHNYFKHIAHIQSTILLLYTLLRHVNISSTCKVCMSPDLNRSQQYVASSMKMHH